MGLCDRILQYFKNESPDPDTTPKHTCSSIVEKSEFNHRESSAEETPLEGKKERIQWSSPTEFLLTCIGYSVGLGNVWRFPYLCYKNGGGAFLIPYIIMIMFIGFPLLFMEYSFGQYFGVGSLSIFKQVCPLFQGVGIGYSILNGLVGIYYNVIIAISIYYMFGSMTATMPWATCDNAWNTKDCGDPVSESNETDSSFNTSQANITFNHEFQLNNTGNASTNIYTSLLRTSPSDEFFRLSLMGESEDSHIGNLGYVQWRLCLCLLLSWILVALFVSQGIKSSGKVSYFTATFPYVMLTVLVIRGVTLEGAYNGLIYFIVPDWKKLLSPDVWFQAATQLFYSLNLAWGGMITMSSYNMRNHNCYRDAIVINIVSFCTSLYAGIAVFSIIGFMAHEYNVPIEDVIKSGPGLAFIAYPRALSLMPFAQLWTALFFFMLFLLGIGSQMVCVETIMTGIMDTWRFLVMKWQYRVATIAVVCSMGFFLGIPCTTQGGMYVLQLMDHYSAGFCVLVIAIIECIVISWIYGDRKMSSHISVMMPGSSLGPIYRICWKFISPALITIILIFSFVRYTPVVYGRHPYPMWADAIGWLLTLASNIPIVIVAVYIMCKAKGSTLRQKWKFATTPLIDEEAVERPHKESIYLNTTRDIGQHICNDIDLTQFSEATPALDNAAENQTKQVSLQLIAYASNNIPLSSEPV